MVLIFEVNTGYFKTRIIAKNKVSLDPKMQRRIQTKTSPIKVNDNFRDQIVHFLARQDLWCVVHRPDYLDCAHEVCQLVHCQEFGSKICKGEISYFKSEIGTMHSLAYWFRLLASYVGVLTFYRKHTSIFHVT